MNTIEPCMCGDDAVFLLNYFDHLLFIWLSSQELLQVGPGLPRGEQASVLTARFPGRRELAGSSWFRRPCTLEVNYFG